MVVDNDIDIVGDVEKDYDCDGNERNNDDDCRAIGRELAGGKPLWLLGAELDLLLQR